MQQTLSARGSAGCAPRAQVGASRAVSGCVASICGLRRRVVVGGGAQKRRTGWLTCATGIDNRPTADANEPGLPPSAKSKGWFRNGWGRGSAEGESQAPTGESTPGGASWSRGGSASASAPAPVNAPAPRAVSVARESPPRKETAQQSWVPQRPQLPLFRSGADGLALPALRRPDWAPQWLDPFDPSSDLRRWIFPYLLAPWLAAQLLKLALVSPLLEAELHTQGSTFFKLRPEQVEHAEYEAERYRAHLSFEQLMQRAPPLLEADLLTKVRDKLAHDEQELLENNAHSTADLVTDATFSAVVGINVVANIERVRGIQSVVGKEFFSMDSSRQAFLLLLVSDILVGYHSSEGWATLLELVANHYGIDERKDLTALFIAVVPVSVDVVFKYWCYSSLRNWSPDTQVILDEIDH